MAKLSCFSTLLVGKKKKSKICQKIVDATNANGNDGPRVKPEEFIDMVAATSGKCSDKACMTIPAEKSRPCDVKVVANEHSVRTDTAVEAEYEGGDEHDDMVSMKRDLSDFDLHAHAEGKDGGLVSHDSIGSNSQLNSDSAEAKSDKDVGGVTPEAMLASGHVSDPGIGGKTGSWGSPKLKRSCSNIEAKRTSSKALYSPAKSRSYDDLENFPGSLAKEIPHDVPSSPASVKTSCSADRVMLKKRSSSQVLPSRSRKLWWRLFLWSHRNLHRPSNAKPPRMALDAEVSNQHGGYTSDTLEASLAAVDKKNKKVMEEPPNQWVAFSAESSSVDRVNAWVNSLENGSFYFDEDDDMEHEDGGAGGSMVHPHFSKIGESSGKNSSQAKRRTVDEVIQANSIIQSMNTFSSVAHISGMGLKVIPTISVFSSLRAVNLSSNFIVHISPASLPKGLHSLDLSRNKIANIEGLRELTRLRVLNLSYNRISRIGHGLSNCTAIKELYLAGNKISDVEGLHRLLKLTVLDLSFNKITTAKALGQLVANYNSLLALNLLGNPIQSNIGDEQLRKAVSGLLPQLAYLNKQAVKPQRAREVATDSVAKAALGNNGWSSRKRLSRRVSQGSSSSAKSRAGEGSSSHRGSRSRSKSRHQSSSLARK